MADLKLVVRGVLAFFIGVIFTVVTWYIVPPFINIMATATLKAIFWLGLITIWFMSIVIVPAFMIIKGIRNE